MAEAPLWRPWEALLVLLDLGELFHALVEVGADHVDEVGDLVLEEVVRVRDHGVLDLHALLHLRLLRQFPDGSRGHHPVLVAVDHQARGGARGEEGVVVEVGGRGDADEAVDLGAAHQQLHGDPGAERHAGDPARARIRVLKLQPVEGRGRVRQLAGAVVEVSLAAADAAEVEAQHGEPALHEHIIERVHHLIVHRAAELRVGVQDQRDRAVGRGLVMVAGLEAARGAVDDQFRHRDVSGLKGL